MQRTLEEAVSAHMPQALAHTHSDRDQTCCQLHTAACAASRIWDSEKLSKDGETLSFMARKSAHERAPSRPKALAKISSSPHLYKSAHLAFLGNRQKKYKHVLKRKATKRSRDLPDRLRHNRDSQ